MLKETLATAGRDVLACLHNWIYRQNPYFGDYQHLLEQYQDIQVVSLTVNWKAPAKFDDVLEALTKPAGWGIHLLHCTWSATGTGMTGLLPMLTLTCVLIQPSVMAKTVIPERVRRVRRPTKLAGWFKADTLNAAVEGSET